MTTAAEIFAALLTTIAIGVPAGIALVIWYRAAQRGDRK